MPCVLQPLSDLDLTGLRRYPDAEAENLVAVDASDRLILDEARDVVRAAGAETVVTIGDRYGALTVGAEMLGARGIRAFQDDLTGELALANNAAGDYRSLPLGDGLLAGATVVLMQLPRSLDELDETAAAIARYAHPTVTVYAGGRIKHMTREMNVVLGRHFETVAASLARQKSRVLVATGAQAAASDFPRRELHADLGLWVCAHGGVFASTKIDIGTRLLLSVLGDAVPAATTAIDLGCGSGLVASALAKARPGARVIATDQSAAAVASARATAEANGVADRVEFVRDRGLSTQPSASAGLIALNPPFHIGAEVHSRIAEPLFEDAARVLTDDGELWTVFNSHLGYRPALERIVGPTREVARNAKFTVTASRVRR